uniref:NADH-ubiquinone oxidoreductase chain 4L n=1 Tax=Macoma balthica TaxID=1903275 RepID=A0A0B4U5F5_MACBL|nr:NADH dehydrogenase subunit 4L [Macoma balthica]AJC10805.1 NADH deshydrogenase subunit 4L [Macoma balthica]AJC10818.1 NADH deshydrogenase subunit 4L [Macoma balthica]AJC10831.1 NADH deshydrogenase subunit 4L [Macoma balthica]AJC10844.1 NADH deshydrogenase subunit 4L [Macoma balthica]AJC10857.1 NADH deshydrogenase subunit 4L [Macoma balthica]
MVLYLSIFLFFLSLVLVFMQKSHFLSVLLVLELMTLSLFMMVVCIMGVGSGLTSVSFGLIFLVFGVYEAANGLGLLVSRSRASGVDQISSLFMLSF